MLPDTSQHYSSTSQVDAVPATNDYASNLFHGGSESTGNVLQELFSLDPGLGECQMMGSHIKYEQHTARPAWHASSQKIPAAASKLSELQDSSHFDEDMDPSQSLFTQSNIQKNPPILLMPQLLDTNVRPCCSPPLDLSPENDSYILLQQRPCELERNMEDLSILMSTDSLPNEDHKRESRRKNVTEVTGSVLKETSQRMERVNQDAESRDQLQNTENRFPTGKGQTGSLQGFDLSCNKGHGQTIGHIDDRGESCVGPGQDQGRESHWHPDDQNQEDDQGPKGQDKSKSHRGQSQGQGYKVQGQRSSAERKRSANATCGSGKTDASAVNSVARRLQDLKRFCASCML